MCMFFFVVCVCVVVVDFVFHSDIRNLLSVCNTTQGPSEMRRQVQNHSSHIVICFSGTWNIATLLFSLPVNC